jgi:hypothetical protein
VIALARALLPPSTWLEWAVRLSSVKPRSTWRMAPLKVLCTWFRLVVVCLFILGGVEAVERLGEGVSGS